MRITKRAKDLSLTAQIDQHNILQELSFGVPHGSPWKPWFAEFCKRNQGRDLADCLMDNPAAGNWPGMFYLPLWLLRQIGQQLWPSPVHARLMGEDPDTLICHCFGVYRRQIAGVAALSVTDITDATLAGGGCTSCLADIEEIVATSSSELDKMRTALKVFVRRAFPHCRLNLLRVEGGRLWVEFTGSQKAKVFAGVEKFLGQNFNCHLPLSPESPGNSQRGRLGP